MSESSSGRVLEELRAANRADEGEQIKARLRMMERYSRIADIGVGGLQLRGLADLIQLDLRCTRRVANQMIVDIRRFTAQTSLTGQAMEPVFALVASGLSDGLFSFAHARIIADAVESLSSDLQAEHGAAIEARLVEHAAEYDPISLKTLANRVIALLGQDGPEPRDEVQHRLRGLRFTVLPDGSSLVTGRLTATATAAWSVIFGALARQRNVEVDDVGQLVHGKDELGKDAAQNRSGCTTRSRRPDACSSRPVRCPITPV